MTKRKWKEGTKTSELPVTRFEKKKKPISFKFNAQTPEHISLKLN